MLLSQYVQFLWTALQLRPALLFFIFYSLTRWDKKDLIQVEEDSLTILYSLLVDMTTNSIDWATEIEVLQRLHEDFEVMSISHISNGLGGL